MQEQVVTSRRVVVVKEITVKPDAPANVQKINDLLDTVISRQSLKNDAALSRFLGVAPPVISKLRHGTLNLSAENIIRIHEKDGMTVRAIKEVAGLLPVAA